MSEEFLSDDPVSECAQRIFAIPYTSPWQSLVITDVLGALDKLDNQEDQSDRMMVILPTGAGKSLCWMLPAVMRPILTVAVFPLLALLEDQRRRLNSVGIEAVVLKGGLPRGEKKNRLARIVMNRQIVVLTNPESLVDPAVAYVLKKRQPDFFVVDEAHTVSQWGETFRPRCADLGRFVRDWHPRCVLALSATAGPRLEKRVGTLLFNQESYRVIRGDPDRPSIRYGVLPTLSPSRMLEVVVRQERRPLIVFVRTRAAAATAARLLRSRLRDEGIRYYHAGLNPGEKDRIESWFMESRDGVLCTTCAYGLGVDKSDVRTVVHWGPPEDAEAYLQESGRASRDRLGANAWLIFTPVVSPDVESDTSIHRAAMIRYATTTDHCRREMLLETLGIEAQDCNGCDVCSGEAWIEPPEKEAILKVVRRNRGRFRKGQLARILIGRRTAEIRRTRRDQVRGFGALKGWELEDVEEAISSLIRLGKLEYHRLSKSRTLRPGKHSRKGRSYSPDF